MNPKVNIVIRTFNEEDWIKHCLVHSLNQAYDNFVITIVDSGSSDATLKIVENFISRYPEKIILKTIDLFKPGNAINFGARSMDSDYFICISAHCIPEDARWISSYVEFMESNPNVVGAYGRQLPLSCTQADDARDLMITFGAEQWIIEKDYFFHNANSIIRTKYWYEHPFDDDVPHIEDQVWAKKVIEMGLKTAYLPQAGVYHYHGLHQHGATKSFRAVNVLNVMHALDESDGPRQVCSILSDSIDVPLVVLIPLGDEGNDFVKGKIDSLLNEYSGDTEVFLVTREGFYDDFSNVKCIYRSDVDSSDGFSLRELMRNVLLAVEQKVSRVVDGLIFYDLGYRYIDPMLGKKCCDILFDQWVPAVMPAWKDYGNYWIQKESGFENIQSSYSLREEKPALYRSVLGQGAAIRAATLRSDVNDIPIGEVIWTEDTSLLLREITDA